MPRPYTIPTRYRRTPYKNTAADRQRIFSIVWEWFVTQGHPRCHNGDNCVYRFASDGVANACAVGIFIPSCASPNILHFIGDANQLFHEFPSTMGRIFDEGLIDFLTALQEEHDAGTSAIRIKGNLREFAQGHNLTIPESQP